MRTKGLCGFSVMWVSKLLLPLVRIRIFGPKTAKFGSKFAFFGHFGPNIGIFGTFRPMSDEKTMQTRCLDVFFCNVGTKTFAFSSIN